jgi:glutamate-ammonia-ligase adenylyltransferase
MRARMARENARATMWDIKHWRGGLIDVEFIVQYLLLRHAAERPDILTQNTRNALGRVAAAGFLDKGDARILLESLHLWQQLQAVLRLVVEGEFDPEKAPAAIGPLLARSTGAVDFAALQSAIAAQSTAVKEIFERLLPESATDTEQKARSDG